MSPPTSDAGQALCLDCGLCCDGSIYRRVVLTEAERRSVRADGLAPVRFGRQQVVRQPCPALAGSRCTIYPRRPVSCRGYRCQQLQALDREQVPLETARRTIAEARRLRDALAAHALPGEDMVALRIRAAQSGADPALRLAGIALEDFLDRFVRRPGEAQVDSQTR